MKTKEIGTLAATLSFTVLFLLTAGCGKQGNDILGGKYSRNAGDPVVFGITSASDTDTRTQYRDEEVASGGLQHIDWLQGDMIRIYSAEAKRATAGAEHWADYIVSPVAATPHKGTLFNYQPNALAWGEDGVEHTFYSVYPSPDCAEADDPHSGTAGTFNFEMPASQSSESLMDNAFMTSVVKATAGSEDAEAVEMYFYPAFTAFEFRFVGAEDAVTMDEISITSASTNLSGAFSVSYSGTTASYTCSGTGKKVSLAFPSGTVLSKDNPVSCTLLTMPCAVEDLTLTVVRTFNGTQTTNTLKLKYANGDYLSFAARKKHILNGLVTPILLQVTTFDVTTGSWQTWTHEDTVLSN